MLIGIILWKDVRHANTAAARLPENEAAMAQAARVPAHRLRQCPPQVTPSSKDLMQCG